MPLPLVAAGAWVVIKGFISKYWLHLLIILALVAFLGFVYGKGRADATRACNAKWEAKIAADEAKRIDAINDKIQALLEDSKEMAEDQKEGVTKIQRSVNKVIADLKKLPPGQVTNIYTTKEGCKPSDTYVEKWNEINEEAIKSIK